MGTRIGIIAAAVAGLVILVGAAAWFCIKTTRKGAREAKVADAEWKAQQEEAAFWQQKYNEDRLSSMHSTTKSFR
jgi:hypothetical protein